MSNRPRRRPQNPWSAAVAAIDGAEIPGGCEHCDAVMVVRAHFHGPDGAERSVIDGMLQSGAHPKAVINKIEADRTWPR